MDALPGSPALAGVPPPAEAVHSAVGAGAEEITLRLLYQLIVILVATRLVTLLVRRLGQTDVAGEILAGLLLGPSVLGAFFPDFLHALFPPSTGPIFTGLAQVGLIFLMFQIGLEFEFGTHLGGNRKPVVLISLVGFLLPFTLGYLTAPWFHARTAAEIPLFGFQLFFAVAMSITALPVLGRILMELGLSHTRTATLAIGAAAIDDVSGWLMLGVVSLLARGAFEWSFLPPRIAGLAAYLLLVFLVLRGPLRRAVARHLERHGGLRLTAVPYIVILLLVSAAITSNLGVFAIIGGFVIGVALHDDRRFVAEWKRRVGPLVQTVFLPIFFAYTGLRTDVGTITGWSGLGVLLGVLLVAFVGKFGGAYVASRALGESHTTALTLGVCMNTRGLMELIVLNIGKDLGLLSPAIFSMLVVMAIVTTFLATPLVRWLMRGQESREAPLGEPSVQRVAT